ncbi:MAG: alpha-mannosidase, partial [Bacteroidetes bacterium]|nr:alpha-mannosidase [Bacteroidota bacterium]
MYDVRFENQDTQQSLRIRNDYLENDIYKVGIDKNGDIKSIFHKKMQKELLESGKSIRMCVFPDNRPERYPAWEIMKKVVDSNPVPLEPPARIVVEENGPVRISLRIEQSYKESKIIRRIRLCRGGQDDRIDILTELDWNTKNCLVKAEFPFSAGNKDATYDLGLGYVKRANNTKIAYEVPAQYWADITDTVGDYGVSVLNDCKYGWDKPLDNTLRLTLLHIPHSDTKNKHQNNQDLGNHTFTYSIFG